MAVAVIAQVPTEEEMTSRLETAISSGDFSDINQDDWVFIGAVPSLVARIPASSYASLPVEAWGGIDQAVIPPENIPSIPPEYVDPRRIPRTELDRLTTAQISASIDRVPNIVDLDRGRLNAYLRQTYHSTISVQRGSCRPSCTLVRGVLTNGQGGTATISAYPQRSLFTTASDGRITVTIRQRGQAQTISSIPPSDTVTIFMNMPNTEERGRYGVQLPNGMILVEGALQYHNEEMIIPRIGSTRNLRGEISGAMLSYGGRTLEVTAWDNTQIYLNDYQEHSGAYINWASDQLMMGGRLNVDFWPSSGFFPGERRTQDDDSIDIFVGEGGRVTLSRPETREPTRIMVEGIATIRNGYDLAFRSVLSAHVYVPYGRYDEYGGEGEAAIPHDVIAPMDIDWRGSTISLRTGNRGTIDYGRAHHYELQFADIGEEYDLLTTSWRNVVRRMELYRQAEGREQYAEEVNTYLEEGAFTFENEDDAYDAVEALGRVYPERRWCIPSSEIPEAAETWNRTGLCAGSR